MGKRKGLEQGGVDGIGGGEMKLQSISVQVSIIEIKELLEKNGIRKEQWEIIKDEIDQKYKGVAE